jgi:hypothetical protein
LFKKLAVAISLLSLLHHLLRLKQEKVVNLKNGLILAEVIESNPLLPNYTLLLKVKKSGDDLIISSANYTRCGDGQPKRFLFGISQTGLDPATAGQSGDVTAITLATWINYRKKRRRKISFAFFLLELRPKKRIKSFDTSSHFSYREKKV